MGAVRVRRDGLAAGLAGALLLTGCTGSEPTANGSAQPTTRTSSADPSPTASPTEASESPGEDETPRLPRISAGDVDAAIAMRTVRHLAGEIGPRHATSPAYRRAVRWVAGELRRLGYDVRTQAFDVPGGISWGTPVAAGRSTNVIATLPGVARRRSTAGGGGTPRHRSAGARRGGQRLRGRRPAGGRHGRGGAADPAARSPSSRSGPRSREGRPTTTTTTAHAPTSPRCGRPSAARWSGMVSLDRVGVGGVVPVGSADPSGSDPHQRELVAAARRAGVPVQPGYNRSSDHWSFVRDGLPGARLGSTPYAGYHSPGDVPAVVRPDQLERVGRIVARLAALTRPGWRQPRNGPVEWDHTSSRMPSPTGPRDQPRGEGRVHPVGRQRDPHQPAVPERRREGHPLHGLLHEVHVEDEVAQRVGEHGAAPRWSSPCTQCG